MGSILLPEDGTTQFDYGEYLNDHTSIRQTDEQHDRGRAIHVEDQTVKKAAYSHTNDGWDPSKKEQ